jgi:glycosyltransferase involved in cell wall biosynthesis
MKILHVNHRDIRHPKMGGLENVVHELSRRWVKQGHEVTILCSGFDGGSAEEVIEGIRIFRIGREEYFNFIAGPWLKRRNALGADVVLEHLSKVACFVPRFLPNHCCMAHVPHLFGKTIYEEVSFLTASYVYFMERRISKGYGHLPIWALCQTTADELVHMGIAKERIQVISGGVDTAFFSTNLEPTIHPTAIYVGRLRKYKGLVHPLLDAWRVVLQKHPQARLQIVGKGDYEKTLREEIHRYGLETSIDILGYVSEERKRELYRSAWFVVYPSAKEGWGLPVIEAGALGVPTIASNSPGLKEAVKDSETGLLVPHGDVPALAQGMLRLIEDTALRQRLGEASKIWSRQFDWDVMAKQVLDFMIRHCSLKKGSPL